MFLTFSAFELLNNKEKCVFAQRWNFKTVPRMWPIKCGL